MWKLKRAIGGEAKEILGLFDLVYQNGRSKEEFQWLYQNNPSGPARAWLAVDEGSGTILSARPVFPWRMKVLNKEVIVAQAGDAMTHPAYQGRGIFTSLVKTAWSELAEQGIPLVYTFPNDASMSIHRKVIGGTEVVRLRRMVKPLRTHDLFSKMFGRNIFSRWLGRALEFVMKILTENQTPLRARDLAIREVKRFDRRFDALWEQASKQFEVVCVRDSKFLNWRYIDTPKNRHIVLSVEQANEVLGFAVLEIEQSNSAGKSAYVVDLFAIQDPRVLRSLLSGVVTYFRERGVVRITAWVAEESNLARVFKRAGFISRSDSISVVVHLLTDAPHNHVLLERSNWFITLGDRDIETVAASNH